MIKYYEENNEKQTYMYDGPMYQFNVMVRKEIKPLYTQANSVNEAYRNLLSQAKKDFYKDCENYNELQLDIDKDKIKVVDDSLKTTDSDNKKPIINDPKYNFDDRDREDDYIVEDSELNKEDNKLNEYKISFDFDIDNIIASDDNYKVDVLDFDDSYFVGMFTSENDIKEFENWFNSEEENKITIDSIQYKQTDDYSGEIYIKTKGNTDKNELMNSLLYYMFDQSEVKLYVNITGSDYEQYWTGKDVSDKKVDFNYDETYIVDKYNHEKIEKIK